MIAPNVPQKLSMYIRDGQSAAPTAPMPDARPWRRGQAPQPRSGAPKAQGLMVAIAGAAPFPVPSIAPDAANLNSTGAEVPMNAFNTSPIYTSLTDATTPRDAISLRDRYDISPLS